MLVISKQTLLFQAEGKDFRLEHSTTPVVAPDWIRDTKLFELATSDDTLVEYDRPGSAKAKQQKTPGDPNGLQGGKTAADPQAEEKARQEQLRQEQAKAGDGKAQTFKGGDFTSDKKPEEKK